MTANEQQASNLADLVTQTLADVEVLREGLVHLSVELQGLPGFIRSYVEKELSQATDLTLPEWSSLFEDLSRRLTVLNAAVEHRAVDADAAQREARSARPDEFADLADNLQVLRTFLSRAPGKLAAVPSLLMGQRERAEFIANVEQQVARLDALIVTLPRLAQEAANLALS